MTIPFLDIFKRATARFTQSSEPAVPAARAVPAAKPSNERLSKTVMPNMTRSSAPPDPFKAATDTSPNLKMPGTRPNQLPPSVALALQPKVERAISLQLCDILNQMPAGSIKPVESFDPAQRILLKASEIEKGMASGKPMVSLVTIYEQVPDIFLRNVPPDDLTRIGLPYDKVLEQFRSLQIRDDQEEEQDVPQLETPILQVTLEDTKRFGTPMPSLQASANPPVRVEPASARALSSAEPEPAARETFAPSINPNAVPLNVSSSPTTKPSPAPSDSTPPTRIPFKLPPNGTGGSDSERVPASSGPPVPTSVSKPPASTRIPFKISAPCDDLKPKLTLVPGVAGPEKEDADEGTETTTVRPDVKISLSLPAILRNMPVFQLNGGPEAVAADTRIEFSLALVQSQLASGRIAIPAKMFREALPQDHRELIIVDEANSPVLLPLQEVLKNLPETVLKMREDQEAIEATGSFETPFSIKAAEDAKRFGAGGAKAEHKAAETTTPVTAPAAPKTEELKMAAPAEAVPAAVAIKTEVPDEKVADAEKKADDKTVESKREEAPSPKLEEKSSTAVQKSVDANTSAKEVVTRVTALAGVTGCSITFEDGLNLAGNLPDDVPIGGLCAMAPSVLQRINRHTADTRLGPLLSMTLHCRDSKMTFFMKGNVCLTVLHADGDIAPETHHKLADMANDLSRTYSQPETVHVDH